MFSRKIFPILFTLILTACGGGRNPDLEAADALPSNQKVGNQKAEIVLGRDSLSFNDGVLSGSGAIRFADVLARPDSANNFSVSLELAPGGVLTLVTNANRDLTGGVEFEMVRDGTGLKVTVRAGTDTLDWSGVFTGIEADKPLRLSFDVHNDHGAAAHILVWNGDQAQPLGEDMLRGKGIGAHWGVKLQNAVISNAHRGGPKDQH